MSRHQEAFVIHDAVLVRGENVTQMPLTDRLAKAKSVVRTIVRTAKSPFGLVVKTMTPLEEFEKVPTEYPYETDGLVFTPVNEPIRTGTHETMFKWKPRDRITIDFWSVVPTFTFRNAASSSRRCRFMGRTDIRTTRLSSVTIASSGGRRSRFGPTRPIRTIAGRIFGRSSTCAKI